MAPPAKRPVAPSSQPKTKRTKVSVEEPSSFVTELASLQTSSKSSIDQHNSTWPRPCLADGIGQNTNHDIALQVVDIDYFMDESDTVIVRLFGVTRAENSVCIQVHGFVPYFYVQVDESLLPEHLERAKQLLNGLVKSESSGMHKSNDLVLDVQLVYGASIYGYTANTKQKFIQVFVRSPKLFAACRRLFSGGVDLTNTGQRKSWPCFEANIDFEVRFMVDVGLVGCGWVVLPKTTYAIVASNLMLSRCQLECSISVDNLQVHAPDSIQWSDIAPLRLLSFDIECTNRKGIFPEAHTDAVIQIANMVRVEGSSQPFVRNCFVIGDTAPVIGSDIIICKDEQQLLQKWAEFVRAIDPDIVTGYNIQNFDIPYLIDRAKALKIDNTVSMLGRVISSSSRVRDMPLSSKQMGNRTNKFTNMEGRVCFDVMQVILRDYKLRSYSLNSVSYHFLGEQKEDVAYSLIADLQNGSAMTRRRLAVYCMKDAYLPLRLLHKLMSVVNYVEMARVTGVPLAYLLSRGQQVKVISQLLRKAKSKHYLLPVLEAMPSEDTFEGATVIEPIRGFYKQPIATLDFASLYPSIMIAHNICYTTLIQGNPSVFGLRNGDCELSPSNNTFVKPSVRSGLLPEILQDLLSARKKAKNDLKHEKDPFRIMVLNGRQLALKISANSVYGFTGATLGKLPCVEISQSVTAYGRQMIDLTKSCVESMYKKGAADGLCSKDAQVVYGDTDSVMVNFGVDDVATAMALGKHAATQVTKQFISPIRLEFEKVYSPFLLINKKRYAGLLYTKPDIHDKMDCKGLETVRRDNCPLVGKVLSSCLHKMLLQRDAHAAVDHAKKVISDLLCNRVDISELIISKELTKTSSAYQAKQAHVVLAERMKLRDAGSAPRLGDRVPYVIVAKGHKVPAYEKAEDPIYVLHQSIPIDYSYYLENQLAKPLARIFEPILGDKAESLLLHGTHTLVKSMGQSKASALSSFFTKTERCVVCKSSLPKNSTTATCDHCIPLQGNAYITHMSTMNAIENKFARLWTECQNCAGTFNEPVLCSSRDCPIFYMREKVKIDLAQQSNTLARFNASTW